MKTIKSSEELNELKQNFVLTRTFNKCFADVKIEINFNSSLRFDKQTQTDVQFNGYYYIITPKEFEL